MTLKQIAERLELPLANIKGQFESLRRYDFDVPGLSAEESLAELACCIRRKSILDAQSF
jgi:hypothetical protein